MKKILTLISILLITGCAVNKYSTSEIDNRLELTVNDLEISEPFVAEAQVIKFLGIDFARLFKKEVGEYGSISVTSSEGTSYSYNSSESSYGSVNTSTTITSQVTNIISKVLGPIIGSEASIYALYTLLNEHPDYDFILYPRVEERRTGVPFLFTTTNVKVIARLGKLKQ